MPRPPRAGSAFSPAPQRRTRPPLTRELVVEGALRILDSEGESAMTFRRLAAELDVGVASLYWHVASREVLLDLALDAVAGDTYAALPARARRGSTPATWRTDLRAVALRLYGDLCRRPWAAQQQLVSRDRGPNQMRVWDCLGRILYTAGFDDEGTFFGISSVLSFVLGYAVQEAANAHAPELAGRDIEQVRTEVMADLAGFMHSLDPQEFPALHRMIDVFVGHDQQRQFEAGLDLLLDGIARTAPGATI